MSREPMMQGSYVILIVGVGECGYVAESQNIKHARLQSQRRPGRLLVDRAIPQVV